MNKTTGAESRSFISEKTAYEYGKGNMIKFRVSGPFIDDFDKLNPVEFFVVAGTTKHHKQRDYYETRPKFNGILERIKRC